MWGHCKEWTRPRKWLIIVFVPILLLISQDVYAQQAMMAYYDSGAPQVPRYRNWSGSSWSAEGSALSVGGTIEWIVLKAAPNRNEYILGTLDSSGHVNLQVWQSGAWGNLLEVTTGIGTTNDNYRGFDIAYEQVSGDAVVVYGDGSATPKYRVWNGSSWSSEASVASIGSGIPRWISLASDPGSDEIVLATLDDADYIYGQIWSGSSWGNVQLLENDAETSTRECFDAAYEGTSGRALVVWADRTSSNPQYRIWSGSSWGSEANANSVGSANIYWVRLAPEPGSDRILMGTLDRGNDVNVQTWYGSGWGTNYEVTAAAETRNHRTFDVAFENSTGKGLIAYGENNDRPRYRTCTGNNCVLGSWSGEGSANDVNPGGGDPEWIILVPDHNSDDVMLNHADDANDIGVQRWTGSWGDGLSAETSSRNNFEAFSLAYKWDVTPPTVDFVPPTDANDTFLTTRNWTFINVSATDGRSDVDSALLEWNGVNESMSKDGSGKSAVFFLNKTNLSENVYTYRVWVNDSSGNWGVSETRVLTIDISPPNVTRVEPSPGAEYNITDTVTIKAVATDSGQVSSVLAELVFPNLSASNLTMNRGSTKAIDGSMSDWTQADSMGGDGNDFSPDNVDISSGYASYDSSYLYLRMDVYGSGGSGIDFSTYFYEVFMDADRSPATGFNQSGAWGAAGYDYLLENGNLYEYSGTGGGWGWTSLGSVDYGISSANDSVEWRVSRSMINETSKNEDMYLLFSASTGVSNDYLPDNPASNTLYFSFNTYWYNYVALDAGDHNVTIIASDTAGFVNDSEKTWFKVVFYDKPPRWRNQGENTSNPAVGDDVLLYAQGIDETGLDYAWLETNESGTWENKTGVYGSPMDMGGGTGWTWSNFTWRNTSVEPGKQVWWRIWYNDTGGKLNVTDYGKFTLKAPSAVLQPSNQDTYLDQENPTLNYGSDTVLKVRSRGGARNRRSILQFDLSSLPLGISIDSAVLELYTTSIPNRLRTYEAYRVTSSWTETGATWNSRDGTNSWSSAGGDYAADPTNTTQAGTVNNVWVSWNITLDARGWYNGSYPNHGSLIRDASENSLRNREIMFASREYATSSLRPRLVINYSYLPDTAPPKWRSQGQSQSTPNVGDEVTLYAQGKDDTTLMYAWLETNESGTWENKTGAYGSPMYIGGKPEEWRWSNFTWSNASVPGGTRVGWRIWYNDSSGNVNSTDIMTFDVVLVEGPPKWRSQGQSEDNPYEGATVTLYAQGFDESGLDYAWLETNESGTWENKTGAYGSPMDMGDVVGWTWSNFTWRNTSVVKGTHVGWRIWYNDTTGKVNGTDVMTFIVREASVTIQPSKQDSHIREDNPDNNYGTDTEVRVRSRVNRIRRSLVQFDLSSIPVGADIQEATLELYVTRAPGALRSYAVHRLTGSWTETGVTWNSRDGTNSWSSAGGDYAADPTNTTQAGLSANVWVSWNITLDARGWYNGSYPNYGVLVKDTAESDNAEIRFASREYGVSSYHPRLVVKFKMDTTPPLWQGQGWNGSSSNLTQVGRHVNLSAQGYDRLLLKYAWLETNESGTWESKSGVYGSPLPIDEGGVWRWSNFTWSNASLTPGTTVGWRIWYNDSAGNQNMTDTRFFTLVSWESYSDSVFSTPEDTFCNASGTVIYHAGYGYKPNTDYTIVWFKPNGNQRNVDPTRRSNATGWLNDSLTVASADTTGEYRAVVYPAGVSPPSSYDPSDTEIIAMDPFNMVYCPPSPEFGTMALPLGASGAIYLWMRRRLRRKKWIS